MFIVPLSTDAPIYHWPWVTLLLIVANVITFFLTGYGYIESQEVWEPWVLEYGNGFHPLQWISMNFLHFGLLHLIGNMVFLWGFGLVVEGKLGWWKYLLVYFGIAIARAAIEQAIMLGNVPGEFAVKGSGGASGVIYGLLAISVVWAPKNEVTCFAWLIIRALLFDVTILTFSVYYIGWQFLWAAFYGFAMGSEVIHLLGALVGFGVAAAMLKLDWVDCENWDLFAVMAGTYGSREVYDPFLYGSTAAAAWEQPATTRYSVSTDGNGELSEIPPTESVSRGKSLRRIRDLLRNGKPTAALAECRRLKLLLPQWELAEADLRRLAEALYKSRAWEGAIEVMEEYLSRFPDRSPNIRLMLAGLLVQEQSRPRAALRTLEPLERGSLSKPMEALRQRIEKRAQQLVDEGVVELDGKSW